MIAVACIFTAIGIAAGIMLNSWIQKIQKDSAIKSADKIKKDAEREAEHLLRDARVSAKAETLKMREECELELKERRREQTTNEKRLAQREELLDRRADSMDAKSKNIEKQEKEIETLRERLTALERKRVLRDPMAFIADKRLLLDYTQKSLASLAEKQVGERRQRFAALCASLHAMSPLAVLARGYAVARTATGTVLRSADEVTVGETIDVTLGRGSLVCTVNEMRGENNHGKKL